MDVIDHSAGRSGCGCGGCSGCLSLVLTPVLALFILGIVFGSIAMSRQGSDAAAIAAFTQCPAVTRALGEPLVASKLSLGCGEYEGSGTSGHASWSIKVVGPKGSGSGAYTASYVDNGPWEVHSAWVSGPDGSRIDAVPCEVAAPKRPDPDDDPPDKRGKKRRGH